MEIAKLNAEERQNAGKESSKKLRKQGKVPSVIYGRNKVKAITIDNREFSVLLRAKAGSHVIVKLNIAGVKEQPNVVIKEIQRDPIKGGYIHVDFREVTLDEGISAIVPITIIGKSAGEAAGGIPEYQIREVEIKGLPEAMPDHIEVDVGGVKIGDSLHVSDLQLPPGIEMETDPNTVIVAITAPPTTRITTEAVEGIAPESVSGGGESAAGAA